MVRINIPRDPIHTHEGAKAQHLNPEFQLRRSVMACMLWESEFYESGITIANRIAQLVSIVPQKTVSAIAIEAREKMKLRHVPLLLVREMARVGGQWVGETLARIIQRPDELSEFLAMYWKDGKRPLSAQVKKGLAKAFQKFNAYQLAKYDRPTAIKLRDVLFLCHAKPRDAEQAVVWKKLIDGTLEPPDTWEVALSAGKENKKDSWERLLRDQKLGGMALLRNLRNFKNEGVSEQLVTDGIKEMKTDRILPFRFITAARYAPQWEPEIEQAMLKCLGIQEKLPGHTVLLVDVSGSMRGSLSAKSELTRADAAYGLAMLLREVCEKVDVFSFSMELIQIPARRGFALRDSIHGSQEYSGTPLGEAVMCVYADRQYRCSELPFQSWSGSRPAPVSYAGQALRPDRLIVITDEQSADPVPVPAVGKGYMLNVASAKNGIGYGAWMHIDGWSEAVVEYIREFEGERRLQ